ncbi:MAG: hypothetical protein IPH36_14125 [Saprospiraceae bacterium]|nr:hypothetical protein [Saprospiraceae bacterium]
MTIKRKWIPILAAFFFCVFLFLHFDAYEVFIFQDGALPKDYKFQLQQPFEEITMKANDGASINGLLLKTKIRQRASSFIFTAIATISAAGPANAPI